MFFVLTLILTVFASLVCGTAPALAARRSVTRRDFGWALGLWLGVWLFCLCAYHRPGLTVGFDAFRLFAVTAMCLWAGVCIAGLRAFRRRGLRFVLPILTLAALGCEVFICNITYFNTHSYEPFQLTDHLDANVSAARDKDGRFLLDSDHRELCFINLNRPIYNISLDAPAFGPDIDTEGTEMSLFASVYGTDEAFSGRTYFGNWDITVSARRTHTISLDLTGNVGMLDLWFFGADEDGGDILSVTLTGITANTPRAFMFSPARFMVLLLAFFSFYALRPNSGAWRRRWLDGDVRDRVAAGVLGLAAALAVLVLPFSAPRYSYISTEHYRSNMWDGESLFNFQETQYGLLAHNLLQGRLYLEDEPSEALLSVENPYDPTERRAAGVVYEHWDDAFYNEHFYVYFGVVPCLLFQVPFEALTGIQNLPPAPCMVILGWIFLASAFGLIGQTIRRWFPCASSAACLLSVAAVLLGSQFFMLLMNPVIYEYVILAGAAFLMLGLWQWMIAANLPAECGGRITAHLSFGSLCVALVAGCRPNMELFAVLALPVFWKRYIRQKRLFSRKGVRETIAFLLPILVVAVGLMWYNWARFGSPFDFGVEYNLTTNDQTHRDFNVARIGPALFTSLLDPPKWKNVFPYLIKTDVSTNAIILTISEEYAGGMLAATPFTWIFVFLASSAMRRVLRQRGSRIVYLSLAGMIFLAVMDCELSGVLYRYQMDFSPILMLGAAICWLAAESALVRCSNSDGTLAATVVLPAFRVCMAAAVACSLFYRFCQAFTLEPDLSSANPWLYHTVSRLVQFWM